MLGRPFLSVFGLGIGSGSPGSYHLFDANTGEGLCGSNSPVVCFWGPNIEPDYDMIRSFLGPVFSGLWIQEIDRRNEKRRIKNINMSGNSASDVAVGQNPGNPR